MGRLLTGSSYTDRMALPIAPGVEAREHKGCTAVMCAMLYDVPSHSGNSFTEIRWLLRHGAKTNIRDNAGKMALDYAKKFTVYRLPVIRLLKDKPRKEPEIDCCPESRATRMEKRGSACHAIDDRAGG
jgi:hypothetical protein